ncbi:MAG: endonuclease [Bacilli bacterium]|nr:endonuclease [Bacilli bacterium]
MKKTTLLILSTLIMFTSFSLINEKDNVLKVFSYSNEDISTYYSSIGEFDSGVTLTNALNTLNNTKRRRLISYDSMVNYFDETDPGVRSGEVTAFYSGTSARYSGNMNREHIWPFSKLFINEGSRGQNDIEKDMHMIRPTLKDENEGRGNSFYTYSTGQGWDPGSLGDETYRGDAARIIFYCTIADLNLTLVDRDYDSKDNHTMGKLSALLEWNLMYPVSSRENVRNEAVESLQGHRNPFIDHPEYACRIWGKTNTATQSICARQGFSGTLDIKLNNSSVNESNLIVDSTYNFSASVGKTNTGTYSWKFVTSSGIETTTDIAEISGSGKEITVTAKKVGETYLQVNYVNTLSNGTTETLSRRIKLVIEDKIRLSKFYLEYYPYKLNYYVGDEFDPNGIKAVAEFTDDRIVDVTNKITFSDTSINEIGEKTITVYYVYDNETYEDSFVIRIKEKKSTPTSPTNNGCGGYIASSSVILSSISSIAILLSVSEIKRRKKRRTK